MVCSTNYRASNKCNLVIIAELLFVTETPFREIVKSSSSDILKSVSTGAFDTISSQNKLSKSVAIYPRTGSAKIERSVIIMTRSQFESLKIVRFD